MQAQLCCSKEKNIQDGKVGWLFHDFMQVRRVHEGALKRHFEANDASNAWKFDHMDPTNQHTY